jgi:hypothetical protein
MKKNPEVAKLPGSDFPEGSYLKGLVCVKKEKNFGSLADFRSLGLTLAFFVPEQFHKFFHHPRIELQAA